MNGFGQLKRKKLGKKVLLKTHTTATHGKAKMKNFGARSDDLLANM